MTQASLFSRVPATSARAAARRDVALARVDPRWLRLAAAWVLAWACRTHGDRSTWLMEEARAAYEDAGLPPPGDGRWWGEVSRTLNREGRIESCGFGRAKSSNLSPKVLWRLR